MGQIVARLLLGGTFLLPDKTISREGFSQSFDSKAHNEKIDLMKCTDFLNEKTKDCIGEIRQSLKVQKEYSPLLTKIANGFNLVWNHEHPGTVTDRLHILSTSFIQCTTQHNCERNVKIGSLMAKTGKGETMQMGYALASKDRFKLSSGNEYVEADDNFDHADRSDFKNSNKCPKQRKQKNQHEPSRMVKF
jgi:hypothetical protein